MTFDGQKQLVAKILKSEQVKVADVTQSVLKSIPQTLFKHSGLVTSHIGLVSNQYVVCSAGKETIEFRHKDTG